MGICSYCGKEGSLTREHIIPNWYYSHNPSPDDSGFMERAKGKIIKAELKIKDVCGVCNNGTLSKLDAYGKNLFHSDFLQYVFKDTRHILKYNYDLLSRWLLKVAYNSARAHNSDIEVLSQYKEIILGNMPIPKNFILRLRTIAPATQGEYTVLPASTCSPVIDNPEWFRVGVFRVKDFDSMYWVFRHVTINSYSFLLYIPSIDQCEAIAESDSLHIAINNEAYSGVQLNAFGEQLIPVPEFDSITYSLNHIGQFPLTYELIEDGHLKAAIEGNFDLIHYPLDRKDIEECNISNALKFLTDLLCAREIVMSMKDKIEISVDGYDDDPRELYEIPEVLEFLRRLDDAWPYWILFQHPKFRWLKMLAVCLSDGKKNNQGLTEFDAELLSNNISRWFCALNELSHKFAISVEVNRAASEKATRIIVQ
jgi:hypothetical protein